MKYFYYVQICTIFDQKKALYADQYSAIIDQKRVFYFEATPKEMKQYEQIWSKKRASKESIIC